MHQIRPATPSDTRAIAEFQTNVWNETYCGLVSDDYLAATTVAVREARWGDRIRTGDRSVFLAFENGQLDGVASGGLSREADYPNLIELMSLYVRASARGSGLGAMLLAQTIGTAAAVLTVFEDNDRAIRFYRRHGFELDGHAELDDDTGIMVARMVREATGEMTKRTATEPSAQIATGWADR